MTHQLRSAGHPREPRNGVGPDQLRELIREAGFTAIASYPQWVPDERHAAFHQRPAHRPPSVPE